MKKKSPLLSLRSYNTWRGMRERCSNPKHTQYRYYGAVGITVCDAWNEYKNFVSDMGEPPEKHMQLDRIDHKKGYCPENCRWVTPSQNCANRRGWNSLGLKGVSKRPSGRFASVMQVAKKMVTLGTFNTPEEAARAYDIAATERFGEFALTNEKLGRFSK